MPVTIWNAGGLGHHRLECSRFLSQKERKLELYHSGTMAVLHVASASNHLESVSYTDGDSGLLIADHIPGVLEVANGLGLSRHQTMFGHTVQSVREKHLDAVELGQKHLKLEVGECTIEEHDTKSVEIYNVKTRLNESNILVAKSCIDGAVQSAREKHLDAVELGQKKSKIRSR